MLNPSDAAVPRAAVASAQIRARGRSGRWYSLHAAPFATGGTDQPHIAVTVEPATPPQILPLLTAAYGLTEREAAIVQAMLRGESTHAIAQSLFLSPYTVQDHFKSIFDKIGVSSRREVATRVFYGQYLGVDTPGR
jgi:DNA-binding NarL/FixJ family response regulator